MPVSSPSDELINTTDAALIARVSADKIRRAVRDGQLPAQRIGDRYLIRRADVEAWNDRRRKEQSQGS